MRIVNASVAVILLVAGLSARQDAPRLRPELAKTVISTNFDGIVLSDALLALGILADVTIRIAPQVKDGLQKTRFVSERLLYATFEGMLATMVADAGLTYQVIDDHTVLVTPLKK